MGAEGGIVAEYQAIRTDTEADLLAMQVGDFFEFFGADAEMVHEQLDLKLSTKPSGGDRFPMAGVPVSEIERYANALVERGFRVAIATQREDGNGHKRAVDRIVTPGTSIDRDNTTTGYLAVVELEGATVGLALVDVSSGTWYADRPHAAEDIDALLEVLGGLELAEVVVSPSIDDAADLEQHLGVPVTTAEAEYFEHRRSTERITEHFGEGIIDALDLELVTTNAVGAALAYLEATDPSLLATLTRLQRYRADDAVSLDATTQRNLELTETFRGDTTGSLLGTIDHTVTPCGARTLRDWIRRPTRDVGRLEDRLDAVGSLVSAPMAREALAEALDGTYDLDRLATRCAHGSASPRELAMIRDTIAVVPPLKSLIDGHDELRESAVSTLLGRLPAGAIGDLETELKEALVDDPPTSSRDGGIIRRGWDDDLDALFAEHEQLRDWFDSLADQEADRHGFDTVVVDSNRTDGYYIQIPERAADRRPPEYERIKAVAAGIRYRTDELAENERRFFELDERRGALERAAFEELLDTVRASVHAIRTVAGVIGTLDVYISLATHAARNDWVRPSFRSDGVIEIDRGRHPVVEQEVRFVPNDIRFDQTHRQLLVTGPNMSGKSTYLRQVALITLLAQIGAYVPADRAAIAPVDGIYTRVGALDELAQGRSTFMVEMQELARILHRATDQSLVILDEVGRGTSTFDGISIAWATTEYLHNEVGARTLFATHYHELTALANYLDGVANYHVAVDDSEDDVVFLRTVKPGATDRSYGIHVADLAGVPLPVVDRATGVLKRLREDKPIEARGHPAEATQVVFDLEQEVIRAVDEQPESPELDAAIEAVLSAIESIDLESMTPLEVVDSVRQWRDQLHDG